MNCGTCANAVFDRTPKGRIKRNYAGRCSLENELVKQFEDSAPPCVVVQAYRNAIWPDTYATNCGHYKSEAKATP